MIWAQLRYHSKSTLLGRWNGKKAELTPTQDLKLCPDIEIFHRYGVISIWTIKSGLACQRQRVEQQHCAMSSAVDHRALGEFLFLYLFGRAKSFISFDKWNALTACRSRRLLKGGITDTLTLNFERSKPLPFEWLAYSFGPAPRSFLPFVRGTQRYRHTDCGKGESLSSSAAGGRELADRSEFGFKAVRKSGSRKKSFIA